ncbi:hypothetical protein EVAR_16010_1 [Eumeta japonica]|uniref:Uncharacterized protein n=1 Tax=Eumeta variegata TaxID=151549 RepID=A0A4C1VW25_EUMVA|nr:hypothetical protein EVAR_16010_1 [Eumeta japonica]
MEGCTSEISRRDAISGKAYHRVKRSDLRGTPIRAWYEKRISTGISISIQWLQCVIVIGAYTDLCVIRKVVRTGTCRLTVTIQQPVRDSLYDLKVYDCGLRVDEMSDKCLLYLDDRVILAPLACGL